MVSYKITCTLTISLNNSIFSKVVALNLTALRSLKIFQLNARPFMCVCVVLINNSSLRLMSFTGRCLWTFWFTLFLDLGFSAVAWPVLDCGRHSKSGCPRPGLACPSLALGFKTFGLSDPETPNEPWRQVRLRVIMSISALLMMLKRRGFRIEIISSRFTLVYSLGLLLNVNQV